MEILKSSFSKTLRVLLETPLIFFFNVPALGTVGEDNSNVLKREIDIVMR